MKPWKSLCLSGSFALASAFFPQSAFAQSENLGSGLRALYQAYQDSPAQFVELLRASNYANFDASDRVAVNVFLKSQAAADAVEQFLSDEGSRLVATRVAYRQGVVSAYIPVALAERIAKHPAVSSVVRVPRPQTNVGSTTAQSAFVHSTDVLNSSGLSGSGITVGVLSDSYDRATGSNAVDGVASGDLPGAGSAVNTNPVVIVAEAPNLGPLNGLVYIDEGRAMLEIIHDMAPEAKLAFATAFSTDVDFANNIVALRTDPNALCDLIVDDIIYLNEPMFSDGIVAQAVDAVVTSDVLAGKKAAYFSAAGNNGNDGYASDFRLVTLPQAAALTNQNLNPAGVPAGLYGGGFHDFDPGPGVDISQTVRSEGGTSTVIFQWDDPFDVVGGGVTTDYNLLIFDANGNYLSALSGIDNNFATNQPIEFPATDLTASEDLQIVIARTAAGPQLATKLRYVVFASGVFSGEYIDVDTPTIYGHAAAENAIAVAAYVYDDNPLTPELTPGLEDFSSFGTVEIAFDAAGNRLAQSIQRMKPSIAAADGVNTTFFPPGNIASTDYDGDGFPNFFGTSAAAPSATSVAALVLEAAGGPGALSPADLLTALEGSAVPRDIEPGFISAVLSNGTDEVTVSAAGDGFDDANFFNVSYDTGSSSITDLVFNLVPADLEFDPNPTTGFPLTIGSETDAVSVAGATGGFSVPTVSGGFQVFSGSLLPGSFAAGGLLAFGVDRDTAGLGSGGNSADLLEDTALTITLENGSVLTGSLLNNVGTGFSTADGFGFIDGIDAVNAVLP